jgi:hypothetical protein
MTFKELKNRLARLESIYESHEPEALANILAKGARLSPEQRRARIAELENRVVAASGMEPTPENRRQVLEQFMLEHGIAPLVVARLSASTAGRG